MEPQDSKSKLDLLFELFCSKKTLEFKHIIAFCYGNQQSLAIQGHVPSPQVWAMAQIFTNILGFMVQH
jgi:hypothetical protein